MKMSIVAILALSTLMTSTVVTAEITSELKEKTAKCQKEIGKANSSLTPEQRKKRKELMKECINRESVSKGL